MRNSEIHPVTSGCCGVCCGRVAICCDPYCGDVTVNLSMKALLSILIIGGIAGLLIYARQSSLPKAVPTPPPPPGLVIDKPADPPNVEQKAPQAEEEARYAAALKECIRRKKRERAYFSEDVPGYECAAKAANDGRATFLKDYLPK
jgi:hypothetical protein